MSWRRSSHQKSFKSVRRVRVPLCVSHCEDCGNVLPVTHQVARYGLSCYSCWLVTSRVVVDVAMASQ